MVLKKVSVKWTVVILVVLVLLTGCSSVNPSANDTDNMGSIESASKIEEPSEITDVKDDNLQTSSDSIVYKNKEYGFEFTLPSSWSDYTIVTDSWESNQTSDNNAPTGPLISIRHPLWTPDDPRQDIPIMVFNTEQWNDLQQDKFFVSAAPIHPSELGHNSNYYFALPPRYNYAFPTGFEEVQAILDNNPLKPIEK